MHAPLHIFPRRVLLLLHKSLHPNLLIATPKQAMKHPSLKLDPVPQPELLALAHDLLRRLHRHAAEPRDLRRRRHGPVDALLGPVVAPRREPPPLCRRAVDEPPRQHHLHRLALADRARQPLAPACARYRAERDLRLSELRGRGAVYDVGHHGQLAPAAERKAVHGRDQRLRERSRDVRPRLDEVGAVRLPEGQRRHFRDIGAGGEGFVRARQDDGADGGALRVGCQSAVEVREERGGESVELFGAV